MATTANITIATDLNAGDVIDGITLVADDRVLVKDQSTASGNGIYIVAASPARAYDVSTDDPAFGFLVFVREGTAGAQTLWRNTNTSAPTIGTTALTFAATGGGAPTGAAGGDLSGTYPNPSVVDDSHVHTAATLPPSTGDHEHMIDAFNGDGVTTVFHLTDEPLDPEAVFAFVGGSWTAVTMSGDMNTTATFAAAPATGSSNVILQYPAVSA